jgi:hypothetical protein
MNKQNDYTVAVELQRLLQGFFDAVSFEAGGAPSYKSIHALFTGAGLLIKNSGAVPELSNVTQFIEPRQASVDAGELTRFYEAELRANTQVFGNVAHRLSTYAKSGVMNGVPFETKGVISTQFVHTPAGWKMSAMAWDDERAGLTLPAQYLPT